MHGNRYTPATASSAAVAYENPSYSSHGTLADGEHDPERNPPSRSSFGGRAAEESIEEGDGKDEERHPSKRIAAAAAERRALAVELNAATAVAR